LEKSPPGATFPWFCGTVIRGKSNPAID
jgi:hypothetical protein